VVIPPKAAADYSPCLEARVGSRQHFQRWSTAMTSWSRTPPRPIGDNPYDVVANQRDRWKYNLKVFEEFKGAEKRGTSILLMVTANNASASHVLKNFITESRTIQANANAAARILDPAHVDLP
jgi:hypothetical protein